MEGYRRRASRVRGAAVGVVLVVGVLATVATTPGERPCPEPSASTTTSAFFGQQRSDLDRSSWQVDVGEQRSGAFSVRAVHVRVQTCAAHGSSDGTSPVDVELSVVDHGSGTTIRSFAEAARVVDGNGRARAPVGVQLEDEVTLPDGARQQEVELTFDLPLDVAEPVTLRLDDFGDPAGGDALLEPIPLGWGLP